jgi:magnesium-transporting ATPase (P-type)
MAALALAVFAWQLANDVPLAHARNMLLLLMVLLQNVDALNARAETHSVFAIPLRNNPLLIVGIAAALASHVLAMNVPLMQAVLRVEPARGVEWVMFPLLALSLLAVMELHKRSWRRRARRPATGGAQAQHRREGSRP